MVITKNIKTMMSLLLIIVFSQSIFSQKNTDNLDVFNEYGKWGFTIVPVIYEKANITVDYGNIKLIN